MNTAYKFVVEELERLLSLPLQSERDLNSWCVEARKLERAVKARSLELPEDVWHFLADADIRSWSHEAEYRKLQEVAVRKFIETLLSGAHSSF